MARWLGLLGPLLLLVASASAAQGQGFQPAPDNEKLIGTLRGCPVYSHVIYVVASAQLYQGRVRVCSDMIQEVETPGFPLHSGDELFVSGGRIVASNMASMFRGRRNVAYPVRQDYSAPYRWAWHQSDNRTGTWATVERAFPFVPGVVHKIGDVDGYTVMGYGALSFVPSKRQYAEPLDDNSVIISIDGLVFPSAQDMIGYLSAKADVHYERAVEVMYIQRGREREGVRRAFIPIFLRSAMAQEWAELTRDAAPNQSQGRELLADVRDTMLTAGVIATAIAVGRIIAVLMNTEPAQDWVEQHKRRLEMCKRPPKNLDSVRDCP